MVKRRNYKHEIFYKFAKKIKDKGAKILEDVVILIQI